MPDRGGYYSNPENVPIIVSRAGVSNRRIPGASTDYASALCARYTHTRKIYPESRLHANKADPVLYEWQLHLTSYYTSDLRWKFNAVVNRRLPTFADRNLELLYHVSDALAEPVYSDAMWSPDMRFIEKKFPHYKISGAPDFDSLFRLPENHMRIGFNARPIDNRA